MDSAARARGALSLTQLPLTRTIYGYPVYRVVDGARRMYEPVFMQMDEGWCAERGGGATRPGHRWARASSSRRSSGGPTLVRTEIPSNPNSASSSRSERFV